MGSLLSSHQINGRDQALVTKAKWMDKIEDLEASLETLAHPECYKYPLHHSLWIRGDLGLIKVFFVICFYCFL